jgi:hypothetical protein
MSAYCSVDRVLKLLKEQGLYEKGKNDFDNFIINATSKAFSKIFKTSELNVSKIVSVNGK